MLGGDGDYVLAFKERSGEEETSTWYLILGQIHETSELVFSINRLIPSKISVLSNIQKKFKVQWYWTKKTVTFAKYQVRWSISSEETTESWSNSSSSSRCDGKISPWIEFYGDSFMVSPSRQNSKHACSGYLKRPSRAVISGVRGCVLLWGHRGNASNDGTKHLDHTRAL